MIALMIILGIIILISVLLLIPLYIDIQYIYDAENKKTQLLLKYLCFTVNLIPQKTSDKKKNSKNNKKENKKSKETDSDQKKGFSLQQFKKYADGIYALWDDICDVFYILFKKAIHVKKIKLYSEFGFEDPMTTGMMTGIVNAFVYNILSVIERFSNLGYREISLNPDFDNPHFSVHAQSIIKIKIVHIIVMVIKVLRIFFKIK